MDPPLKPSTGAGIGGFFNRIIDAVNKIKNKAKELLNALFPKSVFVTLITPALELLGKENASEKANEYYDRMADLLLFAIPIAMTPIFVSAGTFIVEGITSIFNIGRKVVD